MNKSIKVKNVNGSSLFNKPADYDSWLSYWENNKKLLNADKRYECPACNEPVTKDYFVGAHVQKVNSADERWYIVPICKSCNSREGHFEIDAKLLLDVPSNLD
jgi:hypothetical protein